MICNLACVDRPLRYWQPAVRKRSGDKGLVCRRQHLHCLNHAGNHIRRQISAVRPGVCQRLMFLIQALSNFQCFLGCKTKHFIGVPLKAGQIVQLGRRFVPARCLRFNNPGCFSAYCSGYFFCCIPCRNMCFRFPEPAETSAGIISKVSLQGHVVFRNKILNFLPPLNKDCQRRRLNPSNAQQGVVF